MRTLTVPTPHGLTLRCEKATLLRRLSAFGVDLFLCVTLACVLALLPGGGGFRSTLGGKLWSEAPFLEVTSAFLVCAVFFLLPALRLYNRGGTPGKKIFDLRVIRENGETPTFWDCLVREVLKPLDVLPPFAFLVFTGERLGDLAAGTRVVQILPIRHDVPTDAKE